MQHHLGVKCAANDSDRAEVLRFEGLGSTCLGFRVYSPSKRQLLFGFVCVCVLMVLGFRVVCRV